MQVNNNIKSMLAWPLLVIIRCYQLLISPLLGQNCRFYPTCSCYAHQALKQHGVLKGSLLSIKRIAKCHPLHPGGVDEVPPNNITKIDGKSRVTLDITESKSHVANSPAATKSTIIN